MTPTTALLWKEWREVRWFVWVGLGVFLGLPLIGAAQAYWLMNQRNVPVLAFPWVIGLGGVLAVFIAVGITCQDLNDRLLTFWQSRPISTGPWILTKYLTGLMALLVVCTVPLMVEAATEHRMDSGFAAILLWHPFLLATLYSIAFVFGVLVRRMAHAAMLSLAGALLVYFPAVRAPAAELAEFPTIGGAQLIQERYCPPGFRLRRGYAGHLPRRAGIGVAGVAPRLAHRAGPQAHLLVGGAVDAAASYPRPRSSWARTSPAYSKSPFLTTRSSTGSLAMASEAWFGFAAEEVPPPPCARSKSRPAGLRIGPDVPLPPPSASRPRGPPGIRSTPMCWTRL